MTAVSLDYLNLDTNKTRKVTAVIQVQLCFLTKIKNINLLNRKYLKQRHYLSLFLSFNTISAGLLLLLQSLCNKRITYVIC